MRMRIAGAVVVFAALIATTATAPAHADCGDPGQVPCTGPVPTVDQVAAIMAELTDPNKPTAEKSDIVTPGFTPEEAATADDHLHRLSASGVLPLTFVITNIQPAPNNFAGATMQTVGSFYQTSAVGTIAMVDQAGHWLLTQHSAKGWLNAIWHNATGGGPVVPWGH